jgi:hypothetical protein
MGGGITVTSELGRGSTFTIRVLAWMNDEKCSDVDDGALIQSELVSV